MLHAALAHAPFEPVHPIGNTSMMHLLASYYIRIGGILPNRTLYVWPPLKRKRIFVDPADQLRTKSNGVATGPTVATNLSLGRTKQIDARRKITFPG